MPTIWLVAASTVIVFILLCASEVLWRFHHLHPEYVRKFVHITVGSLVAFWPFFLTRREIVALSVAFIAVLATAKYLNIFRAIRSVQRPTWGEAFFAIAVGSLTDITHDAWIYAAALLHMGLADGLAAVLGTRFGRRTRYSVFGSEKSIVGTLAFLGVSSLILVGYATFAHADVSAWFMVIVAGAGLLENIMGRGSDNLVVPVYVAVCLNALR
jgi:phytol kinase